MKLPNFWGYPQDHSITKQKTYSYALKTGKKNLKGVRRKLKDILWRNEKEIFGDFIGRSKSIIDYLKEIERY